MLKSHLNKFNRAKLGLSLIMVCICISVLSVFGKIFEKLIFKSLFEYLDEHKLLSEHQSGFRPNDSYEDQLLSTVHDIYTDFDDDLTLEV